MSTTDEVIAKYTEAKKREDAERVAARRERENVFLETFLQLRRAWLGDLIDVFTPGDAVYNRDRESETATCPITFEGMSGKLTYRLEDVRRAYATVKFDLPSKYSDRSYDLELKRVNGNLVAPTVEGWGEYLLGLRAAKIESDKIVAEKRADERQYRINDLTRDLDSARDLDRLEEFMNKARANVTDFNWQPVFEAASARCEKHLADAREYDALQKQIEAERLTQMEEDKMEARRRWHPFLMYELRYSDGLTSGEDGPGTYSAYIVHHKPDPEGWYKVFYRGQIQRQQFPHIISVMEVDVISPGDDNDYSGVCGVQRRNGITIKTPPPEARQIEVAPELIKFDFDSPPPKEEVQDEQRESTDEIPF